MATAERIERIFSESLNIEIIESGLLDSLVFVTLLYEIEEEFGVELPLEDIDIERLRTIERIADLVDELAESSSSDERLAPEPA
jgi:D-alanine--poly(phosphoribitol) ligase subunit 2